jgi:predicted acetyltransferase
MLFRQAREDDLDRLLEIHRASFADPRGTHERRRNFEANPLGALADLVVAEDAGVPVAHAFLFALRLGFGGAALPVGGIASVGVAPEARGAGVASALLAHLHALSDRRGDALTLLFPFRQGFYARHGYAPTPPTRHLELTPRAVPAAWKKVPGCPVRAATGADRPGIEAAYLRAAERATGWLHPRPERLWDRFFANETRAYFVAGGPGEVRGVIAWTVSQPEAHAETRLDVDEWFALDEDARRALFGHIGRQGDHVTRAFVQVDAHDPLLYALEDADGHRAGTAALEHPVGTIASGPMIRVHEVARALAARGYATEGRAEIAIGDAVPFMLTTRARAASVEPASSARGRSSSDVTRFADARALAAVAFGGIPLADAARLGWVEADAAALASAGALLALPPFFMRDPF